MSRLTIFVLLSLLAPPALGQLPFRLTLFGNQAGDNLGQGLSIGPDLDGDGRRDLLAGAPGRLDAAADAVGAVDAFSSEDGSLLFSILGRNLNDGFGSRVASGFDFNLDGVEDFAVSAPRWDRGVIDVGRVYLISGADRSLIATRDGNSFRSFFGVALERAGDVNGDGVDDLLIGGYGASFTAFNQGEAALVSGATGGVLRWHIGAAGADNLGAGLGGLGDLDGDGFDDYAIGATGVDHDVPNGGEVVIHSGASGLVIRRHWGARSNANYGATITSLRDIDGDGTDDYAIGAPTDDAVGINAGRVEIRSGATGRLLVARLADSALDRFGIGLASGDFDGDGSDDLLVAASGDSQGGPGTGSVVVMTATGEIVDRFDGSPYSFLGQRVANAGDIEGDGIDDFLISALGIQGPIVNAGAISLGSHLGAAVTGPALSTYALGLSFKPGLALPRQGTIELSGPPGSVGRLYLSTTAPQTMIGGVPVLVDVQMPLFSMGLPLGPSGLTGLPVDLAQPGLQGLVLHLQAFAVAPAALLFSRRLSLLFGR